jgi:hypothetical protein
VGQVGVRMISSRWAAIRLIAVRLFAMVRRAYRVDFPISILFEAPTIAACAALIEARIGPQEAPPPRPPERRFTHLVPMHDGDGGPGSRSFWWRGCSAMC